MINFKKKKKNNNISVTDILYLVPIKNKDFKYREDGFIDIIVPRFRIEFLQKMIPETRKYMYANLDELGSATWELIDGERNVEMISQELEKKFQNKISPVLKRLTLFLRQLYINNFIRFR